MRSFWMILAIVLIPTGLSAASSDPLRKHPEPQVTGPSASVTGIVRNNRDQVVSAAVIHFQKRGAHANFVRRTADDGTFSVQLPPGIFHITSLRRGVGHSSILVHLSPNQVMNLEISLQKGHPYCGVHHHFHLGTSRFAPHVVRRG